MIIRNDHAENETNFEIMHLDSTFLHWTHLFKLHINRDWYLLFQSVFWRYIWFIALWQLGLKDRILSLRIMHLVYRSWWNLCYRMMTCRNITPRNLLQTHQVHKRLSNSNRSLSNVDSGWWSLESWVRKGCHWFLVSMLGFWWGGPSGSIGGTWGGHWADRVPPPLGVRYHHDLAGRMSRTGVSLLGHLKGRCLPGVRWDLSLWRWRLALLGGGVLVVRRKLPLLGGRMSLLMRRNTAYINITWMTWTGGSPWNMSHWSVLMMWTNRLFLPRLNRVQWRCSYSLNFLSHLKRLYSLMG